MFIRSSAREIFIFHVVLLNVRRPLKPNFHSELTYETKQKQTENDVGLSTWDHGNAYVAAFSINQVSYSGFELVVK